MAKSLDTALSSDGHRSPTRRVAEPGDRVIPLSRRSLADQVAEALVQWILDEGLQEGDALPPTAELSGRFAVSRTVMREALATLTGQGVLSRSQGKECVIATPGLPDLTRLLRFRIRHDDVEAAHIMECRIGLETTAAAAAATRRTEDDVGLLRERLDDLTNAKTEKAYHSADMALHRQIAVASRNALAVLILDALADFLREVRVQATRHRRARGMSLDHVIEEHRRVIDAIANGDSEAAEQAMRAHLTHTAEEFD